MLERRQDVYYDIPLFIERAEVQLLMVDDKI
jgi:hypothetical protein